MDIKRIIENNDLVNRVVSVFIDLDDKEKHETGFIIGYDDQYALIAHINPRGEYDGFVVNYLNDIYRIDFNGLYELKISNLYRINNQNHPTIEFDSKSDSILKKMIDYSIKHRTIVTIQMDDVFITGFVTSIFKETVLIDVIDDNGVLNGKTSLDISYIDALSVDTDYEQDILKLYNLHNSN